jgi:hypothetical protein
MKTDTSEKGLEALIVGDMTASGWIAGNPNNYDRSYAVDLVQLRAFVAATHRRWSKLLWSFLGKSSRMRARPSTGHFIVTR